jgi:hypothetical protein
MPVWISLVAKEEECLSWLFCLFDLYSLRPRTKNKKTYLGLHLLEK